MTDIQLRYVHGYRDRHGSFRYYFRRKGERSIALPGLPGSDVFMAAYHAALGGVSIEPKLKHGPRCLSALIGAFTGSTRFKNLSKGSQKTYRHILKHIEARDGHRGVADLPDDKARKIIEEIGTDRPALATLTRAVMRQLFKYAITLKWRTSNPFPGSRPTASGHITPGPTG
ncbi:MAG: hypothetical protein ACRD9W_28745, partial [Terriglobia bacterium]